jgi:arylformamidase
MSGRRIHDISQTLRAGIPVWPGEPAFALTANATISATCPVNVGAMSTPLHVGTHADAPLHYDPQGSASADCALDAYIGPCLLIDVSHAGATVLPEHIDWAALDGCERALLRTYRAFPASAWDSDFTAVSAQVIRQLASCGVRLIGTDAASLDPEQSKTMDAHHAVKAAGMQILEGLVLDDVPPGRYELIALPLKIAGGDASPVRAILRELA